MKVCPNKSSSDWKQLVDSVGEFEAYRVFISNNYEVPVNNQKESLDSKVSKETLDKILINLSSKTGLKYQYDRTLPVVGRFVDGKIIINPNKAGLDSPFHEALHPFIHLIKTENPALYLKLTREVQTATYKGKSILEYTKQKYKGDKDINGEEFTEKNFIEEAIVTAAGLMSSEEFLKNPNNKGIIAAIKKLWNKIEAYFKEQGIVPIELSENTTLRDIAKMMTSSEKIDLSSAPESYRISHNSKESLESNPSTIVKDVFKGKDKLSASEVLEGISKHGKPVWATMAKRLAKYDHNNVDVIVLPKSEMSRFAAYDEADNPMIPGGIYLARDNKVYIAEDQDVKVLIHEILHAMSYHHLKSDSQSSKELNKYYQYLKKNHLEVFDSKASKYAMMNLDEFMVGIFTNPEFIAKLKSIEGIKDKKASIWDELVDFFSAMFNHFGFSQAKGQSMFEESLEAAINVLEESKDETESYISQYEDEYSNVASPSFVEDLHEEAKNESKVFTDIKDNLNRLISILKNRANSATTKQSIDKLRELKDKLNLVEEAEGIQMFIQSAADITKSYKKVMSEIKKNPDDLSNIDLLAFNDKFISTFNVLNDLQKTMSDEDIKANKLKIKTWKEARDIARNEGKEGAFLDANPVPFDTTKTLSKTVEVLTKLHHDYIELSRNLISKRLFSQYTEEQIQVKKDLKAKLLKANSKDARGLAMVTTWQELAEQFKESSRDIGFFERWTSSAMGGSTSDIISLTSQMIIDSTENDYYELKAIEEELGEAYEKYAKVSGANKNNVEEFNKPFYEVVTRISSEGKETKVKQFIEEFDMEKFSRNETQFYMDNKALKEKNPKEYAKKLANWYRANKVNKANALDIIEARKSSMTEYEFEEWSKRNIINLERKKFKGELTQPSEFYKSEKYKELKRNAPAFEYYTALKNTMESLKLLLPTDKADRFGNMVPTVYKGDWEFGVKGSFENLKSKIKQHQGDTQYELVDMSGKSNREIPFHFSAPMDADITSSDLLQSVLKAAKHWKTAHSKMKYLSEIQVIQDITSYSTENGLKVNKTNALGENKVNPFSTLKNILNKEGQTHLQNRLDEVIKDQFFGIAEEKELFSVPILGEVNVDKAVSNTLKVTSIIQLSGAWLGSTVNAAIGNLSNLVEAHSGEFVKKRNLAKGLKEYGKHTTDFIVDRNKLVGKSWFTEMVEEYGLLEGEYLNSYGENVSGSRLKKEASISVLMGLNGLAEHEIHVTNGLGFMDSVKLIDGKFIDRPQFNKTGKNFKEFDFAQSLLDILVENKGKLPAELKDKWGIKDISRLKHRIYEVNKYVHGNYSTNNKTALQRRWYGKLAIMFRKYVFPGFAKRFGRERYNHSTGTVMHGTYASTAQAIKEFYVSVFNEARTVGILEAMQNYKFTDLQKANMRRTFAESVILFTVLAVGMALTPDDDEEPNTYWENVNLLLARRMQGELMFYIDPRESWRILKTPAVSMSVVESGIDFMGGLLFDYGDEAVYQRDTGIWEKGDSKDLARLVKLLPVVKGLVSGATPDEQLKVFNR